MVSAFLSLRLRSSLSDRHHDPSLTQAYSLIVNMQVFKFAVYLSVPIALTYFVVYNPENLKAVIEHVSPGRVLVAFQRRIERTIEEGNRAGEHRYCCLTL